MPPQATKTTRNGYYLLNLIKFARTRKKRWRDDSLWASAPWRFFANCGAAWSARSLRWPKPGEWRKSTRRWTMKWPSTPCWTIRTASNSATAISPWMYGMNKWPRSSVWLPSGWAETMSLIRCPSTPASVEEPPATLLIRMPAEKLKWLGNYANNLTYAFIGYFI